MMEPPLSKSAVNHRLRRLMEIAEGTGVKERCCFRSGYFLCFQLLG